MTQEDIQLVIKAYFKVNEIERKAHGEGGLYQFSQTEEYWEDILLHYNYLKENYDRNKTTHNLNQRV